MTQTSIDADTTSTSIAHQRRAAFMAGSAFGAAIMIASLDLLLILLPVSSHDPSPRMSPPHTPVVTVLRATKTQSCALKVDRNPVPAAALPRQTVRRAKGTKVKRVDAATLLQAAL